MAKLRSSVNGEKMKPRLFLILIISSLLLALGVSAIARAQEAAPIGADAPAGTAFSYQGQLKDANGPVTDSCDFQLSLWDALSGGSQIGTTLTRSGVAVSEGLFTVQLDFGANAFNGNARWLETAVRCPSGGGVYNTLTPRQPLTPAPYALYSANTDKLDGQHAAAFQQHAHNLLVVAKSGGDFATITDALNSITDNSADNPYVIYVAPGTYMETITMKPYVDIEGAGEQVTKITYTGSFYADSGTVVGADHTEIRFLTVENTGGDDCAVGIFNYYSNMRMTNVTVTTTGAKDNFSVYSGYSSPTLTNMTITATGGTSSNTGIYIYSGSPTITDINVTVTGGDYTYAIMNSSTATITDVSAYASGGTIYNIGVNNFGDSPTMVNVTATGLGGAYAYGVENEDSSPTMNNVTATASGAGYTYGVYNSGTSSPMMINVTATASAGNLNYGLYNNGFSCSPTLSYVTTTAFGGTESYGIYNNYAPITMTNVTASASDTTYQAIGVYNFGSSSRMTNVTASASNATTFNIGVQNSSSSLPMFNVTASASGGSYSYGVENSSSSPTMTNVTATGSEGEHTYGVFNSDSSPTMNNVTATATGGTYNYGIWNALSSPTIQNSVISASGGYPNDGIHNYATSGSYTVKINNSQINGSNSTIYQVDTFYTTQVGASQLAGGGAFGGTYNCVASYNGNYAPLNSTCQP
jgi:hypothetical protein